MHRAATVLSLLAALVLAAPSVLADDGPGEWVQLTFEGRVEDVGGARVELTVAAIPGAGALEAREVSIQPHLARFTTAVDVAALLAQRLERAAFDVWLSEPSVGSETSRRHLFVERALLVRLRLGGGLAATITVCEGAPDSLKIEPPSVLEEGAQLLVTFSTMHAHSKDRRRESLGMPLTVDMHAAGISESLTRQCLDRGWVAERPRQDTWRLVKLGDGGGLVGFSVKLETRGDWLLELRFQR